jgi:hypothetical protein
MKPDTEIVHTFIHALAWYVVVALAFGGTAVLVRAAAVWAL